MNNTIVLTSEKIVRVEFNGLDSQNAYDPYVTSKSGQKLDLTNDKLQLSPDKLSINFLLVDKLLREHFKAWFSYACPRYSNASLLSQLRLFKLIKIPTGLADESEIADAIKEHIKEFMSLQNRATEKSALRIIYGWLVENHFPFFDEDFFDFYLDTLKFGADDGKGLDVIMEMPNRGPLTYKEQRQFNDALGNVDMKSMSTMELQGYFALKAGQVLGIRDVQVIGLKFCDLIDSGKGSYSLNVPRAKQRGYFRKGMPKKKRPVTKSLVRIIELLKERYRSTGKTPIDNSWHIVCDFTMGRNSKPTGARASADTFDSRRSLFEEFLGLPFKVTNRRLRKTFCTKLIAKGTPLKVVAELMDHSDLQQLEVYYRQTHHVASKLDKVLRDEARDILDAFNGKIIHHGDESQSGQQIFAPTGDVGLHLIGSCSSGKPCYLNPPLSCYGCASLEAFEDADHKSVVDHMVSEVKSVFGEKHAIEILQHKNFLAATQLVNKLEEGLL